MPLSDFDSSVAQYLPDHDEVAISGGTASLHAVGMQFDVFCLSPIQIHDPTDQTSLGNLYRKAGVIEITTVEGLFSLCSIISREPGDHQFEIGADATCIFAPAE